MPDGDEAFAMLDHLIAVGETQGANPDDSILLASSQDILDELGDSYRGYRVRPSDDVPAHGITLAKRVVPS